MVTDFFLLTGSTVLTAFQVANPLIWVHIIFVRCKNRSEDSSFSNTQLNLTHQSEYTSIPNSLFHKKVNFLGMHVTLLSVSCKTLTE